MPALPPYIPAKDAQLDNWLANFSGLITDDPMAYGLTSVDASNISGPVAIWAAAYALVTSPSTKTATTVSAKNVAKVNVLGIVRPYAQQISLNAGVDSASKIELGLNPRSSTPSPITPPTTNPVLLLQSCSNLSAYVRYRDSAASVSVKAKPYGAIQIQLFGMTSSTPIVDPTTLALKGVFTKSPLVLTFTSGDVGKQFYCAARWILRTGSFSPWSPLINFTVVASN
jgi:hypothetical protein